MKRLLITTLLALGATSPAWAWSNHALASYRAFEVMPEVAQAAAVPAEPLESFLAAQAQPIAALLDSQDAWAQAHIAHYPPLPDALRFDAQVAQHGPQALRKAFLTALRVSPESRLALYVQPDPWAPPPDPATLLKHDAVSALPARDKDGGGHVFVRLRAGEAVAPLAVLASASDEPDYGMDLNLWEDNPSEWGTTYGFGKIPFGNPNLSFSTQAPFHMGYHHESPVIYMAAGFLKRTYPLLRIHQYESLSRLAFRTGHPYWGWRFAGLALHYLQDLTQPYHASLAPGFSAARLIGINLMATLGLPGAKNDMVILLSNRHFVLERYESQMIQTAAQTRQSGPVEQALRDTRTDADYPAWADAYARDTVARQAHGLGDQVTGQMLASVPTGYVNDPAFDFGVQAGRIDLMAEVARQGDAPRATLESTIATLMRNYGAHSRNMLRDILQEQPR
ncbi:MAG: phospholipase [Gammaproteobacteria bacterium]